MIKITFSRCRNISGVRTAIISDINYILSEAHSNREVFRFSPNSTKKVKFSAGRLLDLVTEQKVII